MNANNRDANLHSDWSHYLRDDPSFPHSERSNRHLRRNRKRIVEAVTALFTVDPRLELDDLVVSLAGCHHLSQRIVSDHIINRTGFYMRPKHGDCLGRISLKRKARSCATTILARPRGRLRAQGRHTRLIVLERECVCVLLRPTPSGRKHDGRTAKRGVHGS